MLASTVLRFPWGAREAVYDALCDRLGSTETLARAASRAGITGISAQGRWGTIQSAASDRSILPAYARTGDWARRTHEAFTKFFSETGGTYLDIGANIGLTTLPVAQNPLVKCFAFEPEPTNFGNLQENVRRNAHSDNVTLYQLALLDRDGSVPFGLSDDGNLGDHRVVTANHHGRHIIQVAAAPLDTLDLPITGQLAIKIDAQGAEPAIILGGLETFAKASFIVLEFCPYMIDQLGGDPAIVFNYVASFERVALMEGEGEGELTFGSSGTGCATLRRVFEESRFDQDTYLDVYAYRNVQPAPRPIDATMMLRNETLQDPPDPHCKLGRGAAPMPTGL